MIALGSEMSGRIQDVRAENNYAINTQAAVWIKTIVGRGGYVKDISVKGMDLTTKKCVWMEGSHGPHHPGFDPKALPKINGINYRDVVADNVTYSARLEGISGDTFTGICISNVNIKLTEKPKKLQWNCTDVEGFTRNMTPKACDLLPEKEKKFDCPYPEDKLPTESVQLKTCYTA